MIGQRFFFFSAGFDVRSSVVCQPAFGIRALSRHYRWTRKRARVGPGACTAHAHGGATHPVCGAGIIWPAARTVEPVRLNCVAAAGREITWIEAA